jgi:FixJ family two-component response regulator
MRTVSTLPSATVIYSESAGQADEVQGQMSDVTSIVFVVDDDVSVRESLELLIRAAGWQPETFASAQAFLSRPRPAVPCCLVLDVTLPGLSGLELQQQLAERTDMPIIFITGHGDVPMTVQAMKAGAVEFLTKPFTNDVLLDAIGGAIERSRTAVRQESENANAAELLRVTHSTRTRGDGVGRLGAVEQAGRRRTWHQRDHGQGAPRSDDAQDESRLSCRAGHHGRETRPAPCANLQPQRRLYASFNRHRRESRS